MLYINSIQYFIILFIFTIADTAKREVLEETGIKAECESILLFRQHHNFPGSFGKSDLYVVMRMVPYSFEIRLVSLLLMHLQCLYIHYN